MNADTRETLRQWTIAAALASVVVAVNAYAARGQTMDNDGRYVSDNNPSNYRVVTHQKHRANGTVIGGRPAGCPARYCGCGLARYLGLTDKRLNLAWAWAELFPRTSAQPGAAAVRRGHVMLLQQHVSGTRWIVRDYNGGRRLSWIHERDVRGFVFVSPNATSLSARSR